MPIPDLRPDGYLPEGIHDCTLDEIHARFGRFQSSDRRQVLWQQLRAYFGAAETSGFVKAVIVDGSFISAKDTPGDVDLLVVLTDDYPEGQVHQPSKYNVVSPRQIRKGGDLDAKVGREHGPVHNQYTSLYQLVKHAPGARKGILRVQL